jgi:ribosomal-protein-alanine N-acetyltransferase
MIALPQGFRLRPMRAEDIFDVHVLEESIFPTPWSANSYTFEVDHNPASDPWVAVTDHPDEQALLVGYVISWLLEDEVHIANIAVAPHFRRQGLGLC